MKTLKTSWRQKGTWLWKLHEDMLELTLHLTCHNNPHFWMRTPPIVGEVDTKALVGVLVWPFKNIHVVAFRSMFFNDIKIFRTHANMLNLTSNPCNFKMFKQSYNLHGYPLVSINYAQPHGNYRINSPFIRWTWSTKPCCGWKGRRLCVHQIGHEPQKENNEGWTRKGLNIAICRTEQKPIEKENV